MASEAVAPGAGTIVAAVLLPPLGVFLREGITTAFWIDVVLTLVGWLPGVVFALVALLRPDLLPVGWSRRSVR